MLLSIIFLFGIMLNPFNYYYATARLEILKNLGMSIIAPFANVTFKSFFFADFVISVRIMLFDATAMACFYANGEYHGNPPQ